MAARIIRLADNLLTSSTLSSTASGLPGFTIANIVDAEDLRQPTQLLAPLTRDTAKKWIDWGEGSGELNSSLTATSWNDFQEFFRDCAETMNANGSSAGDWSGYWEQAGSDKHKGKLVKAAGSGSLLLQSGTNAANNALVEYGGYDGTADLASAASHTGDVPVTCRDTADQHGGAEIAADLTEAKGAQCCVLIGLHPYLSPRHRSFVRFGTADADADDAQETLGTYDTALQAAFFSSPQVYRYVTVHLADPHSDSPYVGCSYIYLGDYLELERGWRPESMTLQHGGRVQLTPAAAGRPYVSELATGDRVQVAFGADSMGAADAERWLVKLQQIGVHERVIVCLDPDNEPNRDSFVGRLTSVPALQQVATESPFGRYRLTLELETEAF